MGDGILVKIRSENGVKCFFTFLLILNPLLTDGTPMTFCVMKSSAAIFCGAVYNMEELVSKS